MGGNFLLSDLTVSLLKHLTELVDVVLVDCFPNATLVVHELEVLLEVLLDDEVPFFCSLLAGDSAKVFFTHVIFLS